MKVYESFGTFDDANRNFNLAVQTTIIGFDEYEITNYYDISTDVRFAIVAILQTKLGNDNDLSMCKPNCACMDTEILLSSIDQSYRTINDSDINDVRAGDKIEVFVHHAIGFAPKTNTDDDQNIKDYKSGALPFQPRGSKPAVGGRGIMK